MDKQRQTIYDVAAQSGVSIATVSRVLRGESGVREATRRKVEEVIARCNYQPSAYARGLTQRHTKTFGMILPKLANPNYVLLFEGAYDEAAAHGYAMTLFPWENMNAAGLNLVEVLSERRLDGVAICLEYIGDEALAEWERKLAAIRQYMPVVLIGATPTALDYPSVTHDLTEYVGLTVRYLSGLGHERIAMLGGFDERTSPLSRDAGYRAALKEARLPYIDDYRVCGLCTVEDGQRQMRELLERLVPTQWPTAVIAANDMVALGVLREAQARGLSVPGELSVVGCDDIFFAADAHPPLTTLRTHQVRTGARAVQLLLENSAPDHDPAAARRRETIPCELVIRASCGPAKGTKGDDGEEDGTRGDAGLRPDPRGDAGLRPDPRGDAGLRPDPRGA